MGGEEGGCGPGVARWAGGRSGAVLGLRGARAEGSRQRAGLGLSNPNPWLVGERCSVRRRTRLMSSAGEGHVTVGGAGRRAQAGGPSSVALGRGLGRGRGAGTACEEGAFGAGRDWHRARFWGGGIEEAHHTPPASFLRPLPRLSGTPSADPPLDLCLRVRQLRVRFGRRRVKLGSEPPTLRACLNGRLLPRIARRFLPPSRLHLSNPPDAAFSVPASPYSHVALPSYERLHCGVTTHSSTSGAQSRRARRPQPRGFWLLRTSNRHEHILTAFSGLRHARTQTSPLGCALSAPACISPHTKRF